MSRIEVALQQKFAVRDIDGHWATVSDVLLGSPAEAAVKIALKLQGLMDKDKVAAIEGFSPSMKPSEEMAQFVALHEDKEIKMKIMRKNTNGQTTPIRLSLTPRRWEGRGLVGCKFSFQN
jgi:ATPase subunit of ABC transporter with duplicated ATPase domains